MEPEGASESGESKPVVINQGLIRLKKSIATSLALVDDIRQKMKDKLAAFAPFVIISLLALAIGGGSGALVAYRQMGSLIAGQSETINAQIKKIIVLEKKNALLLDSETRYKRSYQDTSVQLAVAKEELEKASATVRKAAAMASAQPTCTLTRGTAYPEYGGSRVQEQKFLKPPVECTIGSQNAEKGVERCVDDYNRNKPATGKAK